VILNTFSAFYYGHNITGENNLIPLNEGSGEIQVFIAEGSYTLQNFVQALSAALNDTGTLTYNVTVNRNTRRITISANANFSLLFNTSVNKGISIKDVGGFGEINYTGANTYTGAFASGDAYFPQFKLQNFIDFDMKKRSNAATVRTSATGRVEVVKYSDNYFMSCDITLITNIVNQSVIKNNPNGVEDALRFMNYATNKLDLEFVYDSNSADIFVPCILESTSDSREGIDFTLEPLYSRGLTGYFELRGLEFRRLE
jgi:hypothetical protein